MPQALAELLSRESTYHTEKKFRQSQSLKNPFTNKEVKIKPIEFKSLRLIESPDLRSRGLDIKSEQKSHGYAYETQCFEQITLEQARGIQ